MANGKKRRTFAPGCALMIEKPELARRIHSFLQRELGAVEEHLTCCRHAPGLAAPTEIINVCPGCDRRYRELHEQVTTISLWEVLAGSTTFPFPDYGWAEMTILDACPTRNRPRVHEAVRTLLSRMRVKVVEPAKTRTKSSCCGDTFFGKLPVEQVKAQMKKRAAEMPRVDVVVYCVSCIKSMHIGGRRPRHIVDLLFAEDTLPGTYEPVAWHAELDACAQRLKPRRGRYARPSRPTAGGVSFGGDLEHLRSDRPPKQLARLCPGDGEGGRPAAPLGGDQLHRAPGQRRRMRRRQ
jgi:hypothetical protein